MRKFPIGDSVEEGSPDGPDQPPRPLGDHESAHHAHHGIEPAPAVDATGKQRHDGENGGQGVGENVQVGRADVHVAAMMIPMRMSMMVLMFMVVPTPMVMMVFMLMNMMMPMRMTMMVVVPSQQPGAGKVHGKPDHRHHGRLAELDRHRVHQAHE